MAIGTPVQVGHNSSSATSNTLAATVANASATGDLLVALVDSSSPTITSVTDTQSNTYTAGVDVSFTGHSRAFYCANAVALTGADTVTAHFGSTGGTKSMTVISVPGIATTTPNDAAPAGVTSSPGTGTAPSIATGTLAQADEIVIGFVGVNTGNADTFTEASGFTANTSAGTGASSIIHSAYQIVAATTTVTYAPTLGTARIFRANVLSFKAAAGGGSTYNVSVAETGTAADTVSAQAVFASSVTEAGSAVDAVDSTGPWYCTVSEAGAAVDLQSAKAVFNSTVTEAGAALDVVTGGLVFTVSVAESVIAADAVSAQAVFASTVTEAGAAADSVSAKAVFNSTVTEAGTALDAPSSTAVFNASVTEAAAALDTLDATTTSGGGGGEADMVIYEKRRRR